MKAHTHYEHGDLVWFLKSMRLCKFISKDGGKFVTVERMDNGKRLVATLDGISHFRQSDRTPHETPVDA